MGFKESMERMRAMEEEIIKMVEALKQQIAEAVETQPFHGRMINDGKNGGAIIGVIQLSQLQKTGNWSAEYHFPQTQAKAVMRKLDKCRTPDAVCKAVKSMLDDKVVRFDGGAEKVYLNEDTLKILRDSEIGQYAVNGEEQLGVNGTQDDAKIS